MNASQFYDNNLKECGLVTGVPCSFFKGFINESMVRNAEGKVKYVAASNEGQAIALAVGYNMVRKHKDGKKALVLMQNSGVGNTINALTSLAYVFREPVTMMVSQRGGENDEPQHELMGNIDEDMLKLCECDVHPLENAEEVGMFNYLPGDKHSNAFMVKKGTFENTVKNVPGLQLHDGFDALPTLTQETVKSRIATLEELYQQIEWYAGLLGKKFVIISTTGMTGREMWSIHDNEHQIYMVGSMGMASSFGLGMAIADPELLVFVIDGDGALQMQMGAMPTIGFENYPNLIHIMLDNGTYDTTGGQAVEGVVKWARVANSCGYNLSINANATKAFEYMANALDPYEDKLASNGTTFIHIKVAPGSEKVGRPTLKPWEVKERFLEYYSNNDSTND